MLVGQPGLRSHPEPENPRQYDLNVQRGGKAAGGRSAGEYRAKRKTGCVVADRNGRCQGVKQSRTGTGMTWGRVADATCRRGAPMPPSFWSLQRSAPSPDVDVHEESYRSDAQHAEPEASDNRACSRGHRHPGPDNCRLYVRWFRAEERSFLTSRLQCSVTVDDPERYTTPKAGRGCASKGEGHNAWRCSGEGRRDTP